MRRRGGTGWLLAAVGVVVAILLLWSVQHGSCPSSGGGLDHLACTSGPVTGVVGAWVLTVLGGLLVVFCLRRYRLRR